MKKNNNTMNIIGGATIVGVLTKISSMVYKTVAKIYYKIIKPSICR